MRVIDRAEARNAPGFCIFTKDIDGPFLDTGFWIDQSDPYAYIHVPFVEEMGRAVGMVPRHEVEALKEEAERMQHQLRFLERSLENLEALKDLERKLEPVA